MRLSGIFSLVITALLFTACGKSGGTLNLTLDPPASTSSTSDPNSSKALFSVWTEANNYYQMDLRSVQFGVSSNVTITTALGGQSCSCKVLAQGAETTGTMAFSSCAGTYSDCGSFNLTGNYTKSSASLLQICLNASNCTNLK
ncbi:MAG: hypothetical protein JSU04_02580 [Bdellovibrionales bacterium]|nr:hypothetical protein [Bdellovibrionales bacterium]